MKKMFALFVCFLLCSVGSASAVTLSLNPSNVTVNVGDTFNITLDAQMLQNGVGLTNNSNGVPGAIVAWDVDVFYDKSQMVFVKHTLGTGLGLSLDLSEDDMGGLVDLAEVSLEYSADLVANQPEDFLLATLQFECLKAGNSLIELMVNGVYDENKKIVVVSNGASVSVTQTQVPEPSTFLLLGFGLAGVGLLRRRFKN